MSTRLEKISRDHLKELLSQCNTRQQTVFKHMYGDIKADIYQVVDDMDSSKIDWAIGQCERTVEKNKFEQDLKD